MRECNERFKYPGFHGIPSHCKIRIYNIQDKSIVILTEMEDSGTSITNIIEKIVPLVIEKFEIPYEQLILIEHYPINEGISENNDTYQFVTLSRKNNSFINPDWEPTSKKEIERLIGEELEE